MSNYDVSRKRIIGETWFWILTVVASMALIALAVFGVRWVTASPRGKLQAREHCRDRTSNRLVSPQSRRNKRRTNELV